MKPFWDKKVLTLNAIKTIKNVMDDNMPCVGIKIDTEISPKNRL